MNEYIKKYKEWLLQKYNQNTVNSNISRINRISRFYNILNEYSNDECASLFQSLTYTKLDEKKGEEPLTDIVIDGDYYIGIQSLKQALKLFVTYLKSINYSKTPIKTNAYFEGSFEDFKKYIGPKCRNEVNLFCKQEREKHNSICEYCGSHAELQSAHIEDRPIIIKRILDTYFKVGVNLYKVELNSFFDLFKKAHMPINQNIFFLCNKCHNELDKKHSITVNDIKKKRGY